MKFIDKLRIFFHHIKCFSRISTWYYSKYDNDVNYVICDKCYSELYNKWKKL